ncbi:MAG: hypothetical protein ACRCWF_17025 [Beijerinckiaceae bacterium]
MSNRIPNTPLLRFALLGDAAASGATGLLMAAGSWSLAELLSLPRPLLTGAGLVLLPYAVFVAWLGMRTNVMTGMVWAVIAINAIWVVESMLLLLTGWVQPNTLGTVFIVAQAIAVAIFAELQFVALRKARGNQPAIA